MVTNSTAKVLMIGFDAAEYRLVQQWMQQGDLPCLKQLHDRGLHGRLQSPVGMGDDAAWASFYTAVSPGRHGRYFYRSIIPRTYFLPTWKDDDLCAEPFWDTLSRSGKRIALIDVPKSPLSASINGVQLADWRVHGRDHPPCSRPPELAQEVLAKFGDDLTDRLGSPGHSLCQQGYRPDCDYPAFVDTLRRGIQDKLALGRELLAREPWDLFLLVFKEAHCAGHKLWHLHDTEHPAHAAHDRQATADALGSVYRALDDALATLLASVGDETTVVVFSDLGMAGNFTGNHLLDDILMRVERAHSGWLGRARMAWNRFLLSVGSRVFGKKGVLFRRRTRRYYRVYHGEQSGAIRLNIVGRDPNGRIQPGAPLQAEIDALTTALLELEDPDTGRRLVTEVIRTDQTFAGENCDRLPDLLVVWDRSAPILAARSPRIGTVRAPDPRLRTGGHVDDGWFVAVGPDIGAGDAGAVSLMDLAPSVARVLGAPLTQVDGRPIPAFGR